MDVHAGVSVIQYQNRVPGPSLGATVFVSAIGPCHLVTEYRKSRVGDYDSRTHQFRNHTFRNASGSVHCPSSRWNFRLLSTRICPSSARTMRARSSGRGAGPSKLTPVVRKTLQWPRDLTLFPPGA